MNELFWRLVTFIVTLPAVRRWIIRRAMRTPYRHIMSADGEEIYLARYWLFNRYDSDYRKRIPFLPSIRIHHIQRADLDRHLHSHPWPWRSIILRGWYVEERFTKQGNRIGHMRESGYTGAMGCRDYHRIKCVPLGGVWTMFITYRRWAKGWGFLVDGKHVPHDEYLKGRV